MNIPGLSVFFLLTLPVVHSQTGYAIKYFILFIFTRLGLISEMKDAKENLKKTIRSKRKEKKSSSSSRSSISNTELIEAGPKGKVTTKSRTRVTPF